MEVEQVDQLSPLLVPFLPGEDGEAQEGVGPGPASQMRSGPPSPVARCVASKEEGGEEEEECKFEMLHIHSLFVAADDSLSAAPPRPPARPPSHQLTHWLLRSGARPLSNRTTVVAGDAQRTGGQCVRPRPR